jgi:hypothetical protein
MHSVAGEGIQTLIAARYSALYPRTNLVLSVALGSHNIFSKLTLYSSPNNIYHSPITRRAYYS